MQSAQRFLLVAVLCAPGWAQSTVDFQRDIRPLLAKKCLACHGPDEGSRQAKLRLDSFEGATGKDGGYRGIVPGDSAKSRIYARIVDPKRPMPPAGERLNAAEADLIKRWIDSGAAYSKHWAFEKPKRPELPTIKTQNWTRNQIDYFVVARLEKEGLKPAPEADRHTLARRAALDLTGVPPAPQALKTFLDDSSPEAYEKFVDRLLQSPSFGERWARVWLDLARYADTQGYEKDSNRTIWPYRDWVIRAFNDNMPFDQFTIKQLAGDLLPKPAQDDLIATGFHRNTMTNTEGGTDDEEFRDAAVKDRVAVTGQVWMGLTWGCAQCHSHKYDPIAHNEFYQLYAFYNQTEDADKPEDTPVLKLDGKLSTLIFKELPPDKRRKTHIQNRGNFLDPGAVVEPKTPAAFGPLPETAPSNRLGLAQWLVSTDNPLTARVTANRFWARLFGRGIVETEEDFGTQGSGASHPELLDWLATEFMRTHWDMKALLKTIVMSATYRQSSEVSPALMEKDPYNRLLARGARFRLEAEIVRDQALAVSGLLSAKQFGPPVMPWQPEGIWQVVYNSDQWITSSGEDRYRRGIYTFLRRTSPYPSMITYDAPTGELCTIRRVRTNTPLQALATLNDPVSMEAAQHLALRALQESEKAPQARASKLFELALSRPARTEEVKRVLSLHAETKAELKKKPKEVQKLLRYTETLYTADREVVLIRDARDNPPEWRYTTTDPGANWTAPRFDDSSWKSGKGQFGYFEKKSDGLRLGTNWETDDLWLRLEFNVPAGELEKPKFVVRCQGSFETFLNGVQATNIGLERNGYYDYAIDPAAFKTLKPGKNVIAARVRRTREKSAGQIMDLGMAAARAMDLGKHQKDDLDRAAWVVVANAVMNLDEMLTRR
ncbi:MAG: PSD1 domain-containing protein [Bryobacterales bacterium]|nr:PSD1 domain-containing protein [Bryobacterales bacterium]